jgi:hypothetical protein
MMVFSMHVWNLDGFFCEQKFPWATSEAQIDSQTPTEDREIEFSSNELVAPKKKPNPKIEKEKKGRDAFLRSPQVRKLLFEKPSHRIILSVLYVKSEQNFYPCT